MKQLIESNTRNRIGEKNQAAIIREDDSIIDVTCFLSQKTDFTLETTKNEVEEGIDVTDHIRESNKIITLSGIVSDFPLSYNSLIDSVKTLISGDETGCLSQDAYVAFKMIYNNKELVTIATNFDTFDNMVMTSLSIDENPESEDTLEFSATFEELRVVSDAEDFGVGLAGKAAKLGAEAAAKAEAAEKAAKKAKKEADTPEARQEARRSLLSKLLKFVTGAPF